MPEESFKDMQRQMENYFIKRDGDGTLDNAITQVGLFGLYAIFGNILEIPALDDNSAPIPLSAIIEDEL